MNAVGLDGRELKVRRVWHRRLASSNVPVDDPSLVVADTDAEWAAWEQLPEIVREYMREVMPIDQSVVETLAQWRKAMSLGASEHDFVRYLEQMSLAYLNATSDVWPMPPPRLYRVPRYEPQK